MKNSRIATLQNMIPGDYILYISSNGQGMVVAQVTTTTYDHGCHVHDLVNDELGFVYYGKTLITPLTENEAKNILTLSK